MSKQKDLGRQLEHRVVKKAADKGIPGERHWGSGANPDKRGDAHIWDILVEAKVRTATINARGEKQLTIPLTDLYQVMADAAKAGYRMGIMVANPKGSQRPLVVMDFDDFLAMLSRAWEDVVTNRTPRAS
jgi:hypothetical protein